MNSGLRLLVAALVVVAVWLSWPSRGAGGTTDDPGSGRSTRDPAHPAGAVSTARRRFRWWRPGERRRGAWSSNRRGAWSSNRRAEPRAGGSADVAATCDLLALALTAGGGVEESLEAVARVSREPVRRALATVIAGRRWGVPAEVAAAATPSTWAPLLGAVRLAEEAGVPPSGALRQAAADARAARMHRLEVATARLRVLVVLPLGLCFLPAFVLTTILPVVLALAVRVASP